MADNLLVNRNGVTYQVDMENTKAIEDTDLLLVNRNGTTYTVTGDQISKGSEFEEVTIAPLNASIVAGADTKLTVIPVGISQVLPNSTISYTWYRYEAITGGTGIQLQQLVSDSATSDTYTLTGADQGKFIGCDVSYLGTTISETTRSTIAVADGPVAVMHGLRFDSERGTELLRQFTESNRKLWTVSFWLKYTGSADSRIFSASDDPNPQSGITVTALNSIQLGAYESGGNPYTVNSQNGVIINNKWQHVVFVYDSEQSAELDRVKGYIDGERITDWASYSFSIQGFEGLINSARTHKIGRWASSFPALLDGYLSDFYFVDGLALEPEVFGEEFALGWGPLDSSQVEANIAAADISPEDPEPENNYDNRANTDQVWSSIITAPAPGWSTGAFAITSGFDGNETTLANANGAGGSSTFSPNFGNGTFDVEIQFGNDQLYKQSTIDGEYPSPADSVANGANTVGVWKGLTTFNELVIDADGLQNSARVCFNYIKVNGRLLVNNGLWNVEQNWSGNVTGPFESVRPATAAFDGSLSTWAQPTAGNEVTYTFNGFGDGTAFRIYAARGNNNGPYIKVNNIDVTSQFPTSAGWVGPSGTGAGLQSISVLSVSGVGTGQLFAVEVNGERLVDSGEQWDTSQVWSDGITSSINGAQPAVNAFDGSGSTYAESTDGTMVVNNTSFANGSYSIQIKASGASSSVTCGGSALTHQGSNIWTGTSTNPFPIAIGGNDLYYVKVDGAFLVDSGAQWNTSQAWSDNLSSATGFTTPPLNAFDGNVGLPSCETTGANSTLVYTGALNGTLELYRSNGGPGDTNATYDVGGGSVNFPINQWVSAGNVNINSFTIGSDATYNAALTAVKLNGELLVDAPSFGDNGFFLPFDPAQTGESYSASSPDIGLSTNEAFNGGGEYTKTINGATAACTINVSVLPGKVGSSFSWTSDGEATTAGQEGNPINVVVKTSSGDYTYNFPTTGGGTPAEKTISFTSSTINSIVFTKPFGNGGSMGFKNPKVDGKILVDHSSIGVDMSGNDNHFLDENFGIGDGSRVWSKDLAANNDSGGAVSIGNRLLAFDGNTGTQADTSSASGGSNTLEITATLGLTLNNETVELFAGHTRSGFYVTIDGVKQTTVYGTGDEKSKLLGPFTGTLTSATITNGTDASSRPAGFAGIKIGGRFLIDSFAVDTVLDTPMNNYAVFDPSLSSFTPSNGNLTGLVAAGGGLQTNIQLQSGKKYYFETNTDRGYNKGAGLSQNDTFTNPGTGVPQAGFFGIFGYADGGNYYFYNNGSSGELSGVPSGDRDVIGIGVDMSSNPKTLQAFVNGTSVHTMNLSTDDAKPYRFAAITGNDTGTVFSANFGQQPFVNAVVNPDGTVSPIYRNPINYATYSNMLTSPGSLKTVTNCFDGDLSTKGEGTGGLTFTPSGGLDYSEKVEVYYGGPMKFSINSGDYVDNGNMPTANWFTVIEGSGTINTFQALRSDDASYDAGWQALRIDGRLVIDGSGTPPDTSIKYRTLYETWSEWVIKTLSAGAAEADSLKEMLKAHAQPYSAGEDYCEGTVISAFGELWIAVNDAPATTFADLPALRTHPNWQQLNISIN